MTKAVLFIVAHPDDESIFFGASIRKHLLAGDPVEIACVTGWFGDEETTRVRRAEFRAACAAWRARSAMLNLPDCQGPFPAGWAEAALAGGFSADRYERIYTHGVWGEYGHPHHRQVCAAVHRVFASDIHSLAGPLEPVQSKRLSLEELNGKRAFIAHNYPSQAGMHGWATARESYVKLSSDLVEGLSRATGDLPWSRGHPPEPPRHLLARACESFGSGTASPEVEFIPARFWQLRFRLFAHALAARLGA
jgi:LmbE family N-acetylglucosaminyl deacetylase